MSRGFLFNFYIFVIFDSYGLRCKCYVAVCLLYQSLFCICKFSASDKTYKH